MPDIKILIGLLSTYERGGWIHPDLCKFLADLSLLPGYATRVISLHNFQPAAAARNKFCQQTKDAEVDWLMMIDNDMAPAMNLLDTVKNAPEDADVMVPVFYMWDGVNAKLKLCWGMELDNKKNYAVGNEERFKMTPGLHELTKCGTGAVFIRPRILHKLPYPYFTYLYNVDAGMDGTEDIQFCNRVMAAGGKIYGNADITVGHYHSVELARLSHMIALDSPGGNGVNSPQAEASPG